MTSILKVTEIQDPTNGNTALSIDSSGHVLTPARPAFSCRPSSIIARTTTGWQTLDFDTVDFDIGSNLHADGYFVCPIDGIYQFNYRARFDNIGTSFLIIALAPETSGGPSSSSLYLNSYVIEGSPSTSYQSMITSTTVKLNAGDNVVPWYYTTDTSYSIQTASSFSGFLVG